MTSRLRILYATRDGSVPALTISLDPSGQVTFERETVNPGAAAFVEALVGGGVDVVVANPATPLGMEARRVTPTDGAAYLDAVEDMLGRTSRWIVVPE